MYFFEKVTPLWSLFPSSHPIKPFVSTCCLRSPGSPSIFTIITLWCGPLCWTVLNFPPPHSDSSILTTFLRGLGLIRRLLYPFSGSELRRLSMFVLSLIFYFNLILNFIWTWVFFNSRFRFLLHLGFLKGGFTISKAPPLALLHLQDDGLSCFLC